LRERRYAASLERFRGLLGRGVNSFEAHYYAARALTGLQRWRDAAVHYEAAITALPAYADAYLGLADARMADGQARAALEVLRRGQKAIPADPRLIEREGDIARSTHDADVAVRSYQRVAQMAPRDALVRVKLGELYRDLGRPEDAARTLQSAVEIDPSIPSYWNSLGMVLGGSGRMAEGERAFREAVARDPSNAQYTYNLGLLLQRQQKPEARALFERALTLDPSFQPARARLAELAR
jgi:tetratricopeptide (TPR) repeat protein